MPAHRLSEELIAETIKAFNANGGNVKATARFLNIPRATLQHRLKIANINKKPLAAGNIHPKKTERVRVVEAIHRFILTSA